LKPFLDAYDGESDLEYDEPSTPAPDVSNKAKRTPASSARSSSRRIPAAAVETTPSTANIDNENTSTKQKKKKKKTKTPSPTPPLSDDEAEVTEAVEPVRSQIRH
jgi:hypothetical protein